MAHVLTTSDSGHRWTQAGTLKLPNGEHDARVMSLSFVNANTGWMLLTSAASSRTGVGYLYRSTNAGHTWQRLPAPPSIGTINFDSTINGRLNAMDGKVDYWHTQDGGLSWWAADGVAWTPDNVTATSELLAEGLTADEHVIEVHHDAASGGWAVVLGGFCETESRCVQYTRLLSFDHTGASVDITPQVAASTVSLAYLEADSDSVEVMAKDGAPGKADRHPGSKPSVVPKALPSVNMAYVVVKAQVEPFRGNQPNLAGTADVKQVQQALVAKGISTIVDGWYGTGTTASYATWQRRLGFTGLDATGIPGPTSFASLSQNRFVITGAIAVGARTTFSGKKVNQRTRSMLLAAQSLAGRAITLTQGSYNPGGVAASAGTHDGGGVVDISVSGLSDTQRWQLVKALRQVGFAAWLRTPAQGFAYHIHAVAVADTDVSPSARNQVADYYVGRNGLGAHALDNTPAAYRVAFTWWEKTPY